MQLGIYFSSLPIFRRLRNSPLKKIEIELLAAVRKTARHNLRFRIPDRASQHSISSILDRNNVAIGGSTPELLPPPREKPNLSVLNSRPPVHESFHHILT